jgi:uncharacterized protein (TIRG00374 family)
VGLERVLDTATVLVLAAVSALSAPLWSDGGHERVLSAARWLGVAGLAGCVVGFAALRAMVREGSWFLAFLRRKEQAASGAMAHVWSFIGHFADGARFLRDGRRSLRVGLESLVIWMTIGASIWIGLVAAGVRIPFVGVFLLLVLSVIAIAVPTPGGAGTVHYAFQQGLIQIFGIDPNQAAVATVIYHPIMVYIPPVVFGVLFAWRDGLSLGGLRSLARGGTAGPAGEASGSASPAGPTGSAARSPAAPGPGPAARNA